MNLYLSTCLAFMLLCYAGLIHSTWTHNIILHLLYDFSLLFCNIFSTQECIINAHFYIYSWCVCVCVYMYGMCLARMMVAGMMVDWCVT